MTTYTMPDNPVAHAYATAIKRAFAEQLGVDPAMVTVTWGDDETILATFADKKYTFEIGSDDDDNMEFVSVGGDHLVVTLTDDEQQELLRLIDL